MTPLPTGDGQPNPKKRDRAYRREFDSSRVKFLLAFVLLHASGCGWTMRENISRQPIRPGAPPVSYRLDMEASSVEYVGNNFPSMMDAIDVRNVLGEILRARSRPAAPGLLAPPARFRLKVQVSRTAWPFTWYVICVDLQVLGCPTGDADVNAQLELQVGNDLYVGTGAGSAVGGLYYNAFTGVPKAMVQALETAIMSMSFEGNLGQPNR